MISKSVKWAILRVLIIMAEAILGFVFLVLLTIIYQDRLPYVVPTTWIGLILLTDHVMCRLLMKKEQGKDTMLPGTAHKTFFSFWYWLSLLGGISTIIIPLIVYAVQSFL